MAHSMTKRKRSLLIQLNIIWLALLCPSCQDFLDIDPPVSEAVRETVFADDQSATAAIVGIYSAMVDGNSFSFANFYTGYYGALSADEMKLLGAGNPQASQFENNALTSANPDVLSFWESGYRFIWYANSAIEGLSQSVGVSQPVKIQLLGEARFIRAFCHFYLTGLFGDIPYITLTDYRVNAMASKIAQADVYNKIVEDLLEAQNSLPTEYITSGRVRPNRAAVTAFLARVYLYTGNWLNAEAAATQVIDDPKYELEDDLNNVFLATSKEAVWQLMPVNAGANTTDGQKYIGEGTAGGLSLTDELLDSFEAGDKRYANWIASWTNSNATLTTYYPFKYKVSALNKPVTEYSMVFRLAEQFLIRAEARAQNNNLTGPNSAKSDLNEIRSRAGLNNTTAATQAEFLDAILQERRVEFFTEWGHRWFDLKRMNQADLVLGTLKPDWQSTDVLYPIPRTELQINKNLLPQNPGYNN
jgi:starch-binding outer membrane protein, SusD/RagB family